MGAETAIEWADATEEMKVLARQRANVAVRTGQLPRPNTLPCADCGHIWRPGERRHEYDHHQGYEPEHHLHVQALCSTCHARRGEKARRTQCLRGHDYTPENTGRKANGTRFCRECRRAYDRRRRDAAWWRARRARKREA